MKRSIFILAVALAATLTRSVPATEIAIAFDNASIVSSVGGAGVFGWRFSTQSPLVVMALGVYDDKNLNNRSYFGDGLVESHPIGIWDLSDPTTPLVSSVVPAGDAALLVDTFRYANVSPLVLPAGHDYVIGALYSIGQSPIITDPLTGGGGNNPNFVLTVGPEVEFNGYQWGGGGSSVLVFPDNYDGGEGLFGPNFMYTVVPDAGLKIIDFESPLPGGLVPVGYTQGTPVGPESFVTSQYSSLGIVMSGVALVNLGIGHAPSGNNGIGGYDAQFLVDYDGPLTFTFVSPLDGSTKATSEFFSITPDRGSGSDNLVTISAYALDGGLLGSIFYQEPSVSGAPIQLSGIGQFHTVVVDATLHNPASGGIGFDLVGFGPVVVVIDSDRDGVPDAADRCPNTPVGVSVNVDGCSVEQLVPCEGPLTGGTWRNHGNYVSSVVKTVAAFLAARLVTEEEAELIVEAAARSKCGK